MPYTHSLASALVLWIACAAGGAAGGHARGGVVVGAAIASHWFCDLLVHVPDLPLGFGDAPKLGLGLWRWPVASWLLEVGLVAAAYAWLRPRLAPDRRRWGDRGVAALLVIQTVNDFLLPPAPSVAAIGVAAEVVYLSVVLLAIPVDRGRA
jgi:hypothetical protein